MQSREYPVSLWSAVVFLLCLATAHALDAQQRPAGLSYFIAGKPLHVGPSVTPMQLGESNELTAQSFLTSVLPSYSEYEVLSMHTSKWSHTTHTTVRQTLHGLPILHTNTRVHVHKGRVESWSNGLIMLLKPEASRVEEAKPHKDPSAVKMYHWDSNGNIRLVWQLLDKEDSSHEWLTTVDAFTGEIVERENIVHDISFNYRVWPFPAVNPLGVHTSDTLEPQILIAVESHSVTASPQGWLAPDATTLNGNNARAYADLTAPDGFNAGDLSPSITSPGTFDYVVDTTNEPNTYTNGATAQAFYCTNIIHDVSYHFGFDEESGNFQMDNFGKGGLGNDPVLVETQDYDGFDNANFATPPDGSPARMQLFLTNMPGEVIVDSPPAVAGSYFAGVSSFGPSSFDVTAQIELSNPAIGCTTLVGNYAGKIAVIDRGDCTFVVKVKNAQDQGAIGVLLCNNELGSGFFNPSGEDATITIPSVMWGMDQCNALKASGATTIRMTGGRRRDTSLSAGIIYHEYGHGISTRLFGPGCLSQLETPSEGISDFYALVLTDSDGNSEDRTVGDWAFGFPIRFYPYSRSMVTNPLTYNSISVPDPSGLSGQVHFVGTVWQTVVWEIYLGLRDYFGWLDLSSENLMAFNPAEPVLPQEIPLPNCPGKSALLQQFSFAANMENWTPAQRNIQAPLDFQGTPWMHTTVLPPGANSAGGVTVNAPKSADPCVSETGVRSLTSPSLTYDFTGSLFASFRHYTDIETGYDGGNIKVSIAGGPFDLVPLSAFDFNGYNGVATETGFGDTEPVFNGLSRVWKSSSFSLSSVGVTSGVAFQIRFDFSTDGCSPNDGEWSVDKVDIFTCTAPIPEATAPIARGTNGPMPGNYMAMLLMTEGMKYAPCSASFVEFRDAMLEAARGIYTQKTFKKVYCIMWQGFAKRGLGVDAVGGSSLVLTDQTESYTIPAECSAPFAIPDTPYNVTLGESLTIAVMDNDFLGIEPTTLTAIGATPLGTGTINGDSIEYSATGCGEGSFTYTITDSNLAQSTGIVTIYTQCPDGTIPPTATATTLPDPSGTAASSSDGTATATATNSGTIDTPSAESSATKFFGIGLIPVMLSLSLA